jgi:hypothetical protein
MEYLAGVFEAATELDSYQCEPDERRSEPRYEGLIEEATLAFRGRDHRVPVVNISSRGTMVESNIAPRLGESVKITFAGCSPIYAFVRWARDGHVGLKFGCEMILG